MIDLHCHMLPGIDDGAPDVETSLAMARIAAEDGIEQTACTPHIYPGVYENTAQGIREVLTRFKQAVAEADVPLKLTYGADTHLAPDLISGIKEGRIPTLGGTRYFLLEPPHHVAPPRFDEVVFGVMSAGYVPLITHPERLTWVADHYEVFLRLAERGAWMQITSGSLTGRFGSEPCYWGEKMLDDGIVHILATDAHGTRGRPPLLAEGRQAAEKWVGAEEARRLVIDRPRAIVDDVDPATVPPPPGLDPNAEHKPRAKRGWLRRLFG